MSNEPSPLRQCLYTAAIGAGLYLFLVIVLGVKL